MSDIAMAVALLTPLCIQLLLYGILLPIFFISLCILLACDSRLRNRKTKWGFIAVSIIMFLISTFNIVTNLWINFVFFVTATPRGLVPGTPHQQKLVVIFMRSLNDSYRPIQVRFIALNFIIMVISNRMTC
jgi:hypothetical protein